MTALPARTVVLVVRGCVLVHSVVVLVTIFVGVVLRCRLLAALFLPPSGTAVVLVRSFLPGFLLFLVVFGLV